MKGRISCTAAILVLSVCAWAQCPTGTLGLCGDCDENGILNVLDALQAAQMALIPVTLAALWSSCNVDGDGTISVIDAMKIAQVAAGLSIPLQCNLHIGYGLFVGYELHWDAQVIADSYDSRAGPYAASPTSPPWSVPYAGSSIALGTNGALDLNHPGNEVHGLLFHGAGQPAYAAGVLGNPPCQLSQPEPLPPVPADVVDEAIAYNHNHLINIESTADPMHFTPGVFEPYDPIASDLYAFGPGTRIVLGDPAGSPRTYFFHTITVWDRAIIEFVGPTTVVLDGFVFPDPSDGVGNWVSRLLPRDVRILGNEYAQAVGFDFDLVNGFAGTIYAPRSYLWFEQGPRQELFGSLICESLENTPALFAIHYDEALSGSWPP